MKTAPILAPRAASRLPSRLAVRAQRGLTLLEVLVAMLLFLAAASGLVLLINQSYIADAQALRSFAATTTAQSLLATVEGNSSVLGSLDGLSLSASNPTTSASGVAPLLDWWKAQVAAYPDLLSLAVSTIPSGSSSHGACSAGAPCQIDAVVTVRSAFGGSIQHTFILQDGF